MKRLINDLIDLLTVINTPYWQSFVLLHLCLCFVYPILFPILVSYWMSFLFLHAISPCFVYIVLHDHFICFLFFFSFYVQDHFSKILSTSFLLDHLQVMCIPSKEVLIALLKMVSFCLIWQCRKINHCMFEMSKENCNRAIYGFKRRLF